MPPCVPCGSFWFLSVRCRNPEQMRRPRQRAESGKMPFPIHHFTPQPFEIEIGKRSLGPTEIPKRASQNRARTHQIARGVVMKSDRQLNQALQVKAKPPRRQVATQRTPYVLQHFVSLKKMAAIEKIKPHGEALIPESHNHRRTVSTDSATLSTRFVTSSRDCVAQSRFLHIPIDQPMTNLQKNVLSSALKTYVIDISSTYSLPFWNADCTSVTGFVAVVFTRLFVYPASWFQFTGLWLALAIQEIVVFRG